MLNQWHDTNGSEFAQIADTLLGYRAGVVVVLSVYFDESYGAEGIFSVAGYIFRGTKVRDFERAWGRMLRTYAIPYFRMSSCASGNGVFKDKTEEERDKCARQAIRLVGKYAAKGFAVTTHQGIYEALQSRLPADDFTAYDFCAWACLLHVERWMENHNYNNRAAYFFEAGHSTESRVNRMLQLIAADPALTAKYRYAGHSFIRKECAGGVQAADMLAWHARKDLKNEFEKRGRRKDFEALAGSAPHTFTIADPSEHGAFVASLEARRVRPCLQEVLAFPPADFFG